MKKSDIIDFKKDIWRLDFMCKACEVGKVVVNYCIDQRYEINTAKLQKLLVLMHGIHLAKYNTALFPENVLIWECGVAIKEVDDQFKEFGNGFKETLPSKIAILNSEEIVIKKVLCDFGKKDVFAIKEDYRLRYLKEKYYEKGKSIKVSNEEIRKVFIDYDIF